MCYIDYLSFYGNLALKDIVEAGRWLEKLLQVIDVVFYFPNTFACMLFVHTFFSFDCMTANGMFVH